MTCPRSLFVGGGAEVWTQAIWIELMIDKEPKNTGLDGLKKRNYKKNLEICDSLRMHPGERNGNPLQYSAWRIP